MVGHHWNLSIHNLIPVKSYSEGYTAVTPLPTFVCYQGGGSSTSGKASRSLRLVPSCCVVLRWRMGRETAELKFPRLVCHATLRICLPESCALLEESTLINHKRLEGFTSNLILFLFLFHSSQHFYVSAGAISKIPVQFVGRL